MKRQSDSTISVHGIAFGHERGRTMAASSMDQPAILDKGAKQLREIMSQYHKPAVRLERKKPGASLRP